jgi:hypothetical protein
MAPILLRFAEADAAAGSHLLERLTAAGLPVEAALPAATRGRAVADTQASQAVVVLMSRRGLQSPALRLQAAVARAHGKLIAGRIEPGAPAPAGSSPVIDLTDLRRGGQALAAFLQPAAPAVTAARTPAAPAAPAAPASQVWQAPKPLPKPTKSSPWLWIGLGVAALGGLGALAFVGVFG